MSTLDKRVLEIFPIPKMLEAKNILIDTGHSKKRRT